MTIILTTHYIDEAEEMADRIGVISKGEIILVDEKAELMRKLGKKQMTLQLQIALEHIPPALAAYQLELSSDGNELIYTFDAQGERTGIVALLKDLTDAAIVFKDLHTTQSSLEDIFVSLEMCIRDRSGSARIPLIVTGAPEMAYAECGCFSGHASRHPHEI